MYDAHLRASAALIAYAEPFIAGRRVLVFGDATSALAEQLLDRGARLVHMYDPDPARVAEAATRNTESRVSLAPLSEGGLASREGAFDCAVVEDLSSLPNRASALRALRRALNPRGVALVAAPNPDAQRRLVPGSAGSQELDYYGLYDAVAAELDHVRMLGQTPFVGYAIVDFAPEAAPEPSFDSSFLPGGAEEPEQYIALASAHEVRLEEMTIVQLPLIEVARASASDNALGGARAAERRVLERTANLEAERRARGSGKDLERLQNELEKRDSWIRELEDRAATADTRADDAEAELEALRERYDALDAELGSMKSPPAPPPEDPKVIEALQEELDDLRRVAARTERERSWADERVRALESELEGVLRELEARPASPPPAVDDPRLAELEAALAKVRAERDELERQLAEVRREKERAAAQQAQELRSETQHDLERLERQLAERGRRVAELEENMQKLERYGRTLVIELMAHEEAAASDEPPQEDLEGRLAELAKSNTALEADLVAAEWVIAELRDKLASGPPPQVALQEAKDAARSL